MWWILYIACSEHVSFLCSLCCLWYVRRDICPHTKGDAVHFMQWSFTLQRTLLPVGANWNCFLNVYPFIPESLDCCEAAPIRKLTRGFNAVSFGIQGWSRVVSGRVSHHRPEGLHPTQLCCNDHGGDWTVRHTGNRMMLLSTPCHSTSTPSHTMNACCVPEGREVVSSKRETYCVFVLQVVL